MKKWDESIVPPQGDACNWRKVHPIIVEQGGALCKTIFEIKTSHSSTISTCTTTVYIDKIDTLSDFD